MSDELDNLDDIGSDPVPPTGGNPPKQNEPAATLDPEIQRRDAQIEHWREKARQAIDELNKFKPAEPQKQSPSNPALEFLNPSLDIVKLTKSLGGYNEEETDFIIRNSKTKDIEGIMKAEKDEMVQLAIKSRREKVAKENNVPSPSAPGGSTSQKTPQEIANMSRDEHAAYERELLQQQKGEGI